MPTDEHVKIYLPDPTCGENVWAIIVDEAAHLYRIDNMPVSSSCNYADVVYAPGYTFERVHAKGSHQVVLTLDPEEFDAHLDTTGPKLKGHGLHGERYVRQYISFSVLKHSDKGDPDLDALREIMGSCPGVIEVGDWE